MKRHKTAAILALALVAVLLATACQEAQKTADLRVTLDDSIDRTLVPKDPEEFKVVKYRITCQARGGGDPITLDTIRSSIVFQGLPLGTYDISATGRNESGQDIVSGSSEFNLTGSNTSATIVLNRLIGSGHISITFTWDKELVGKPSVHVTLTPMDGQEGNTIEKTLEASGSSATFTANDLPSGSYRLTAKLMDKGVSVAGCVEAVRIADKSTVSAEIPFNLDKLPSSPGNITLENQAGIPIACTIEGVEEGQTVQAQQELEVDLVTDGLEEMSVQVEWYLDGSPVGSGRSITLTPQPGQHRLDVVASTDKLGSSGSTTIKFEAALLGDIGVPVMGGRVTEAGVDGLSLSGDMVMDFLVDGNLMIVDNDANRIQTCAIVRNTLRLDGSQEIEDDIVVVDDCPRVEVGGVLDVALLPVAVECYISVSVADDHGEVHPCVCRAIAGVAPVAEDVAAAGLGGIGCEILRFRAAAPHLIARGLLAVFVHIAASDESLPVFQLIHADPARDGQVVVGAEVEVGVRGDDHILVLAVEFEPMLGFLLCYGRTAETHESDGKEVTF